MRKKTGVVGETTIYVTKYALTGRGIIAMKAVVMCSGGVWTDTGDGVHGKYYDDTEWAPNLEEAKKMVVAKVKRRIKQLDEEKVRLTKLLSDLEVRGVVVVDGVATECNEAAGVVGGKG